MQVGCVPTNFFAGYSAKKWPGNFKGTKSIKSGLTKKNFEISAKPIQSKLKIPFSKTNPNELLNCYYIN